MQVFVPFPDLDQIAEVLDPKRLNKQMVECDQILRVLTEHTIDREVDKVVPRQPRAWRNHPAVKAWRGHEHALVLYTLALEREWIKRGGKRHGSVTNVMRLTETIAEDSRVENPGWWGREDVHSSHRSRLLAKDPEWYGQFGWTDDPTKEYVWPTP